METSITSEMISQQTICGDNESLELTYDTEYSNEKTELEKIQSNFKDTLHHRKLLTLKQQ